MHKVRIRPWWFEVCLVLAGLAAFAVVGPLRGVFDALPGVTVLGAATLFIIPGALVTRWFLGEYFSGAALVPVAAAISVGSFALLGVPVLILQTTLASYLWISGVVVGSCLVAAAVVAVAGARRGKPASGGGDAAGGGGVMWIPFAGLLAACAYVTRSNAPSSYGDIWVYISWIREYLGGGGLATVEPYFGNEVGVSRARINGWLLEQTALSRVSGVEPVDFLFQYMNPALAVVALLGFYALARVLFGSERAALFAGCLYALFFLAHLDASRLTFGGEFFQRLIEDKLAAKFLFLPVALGFAVAFLKSGRKAYFWGFAFLCATVMLVHPVGLAVIGISMAGFAIFHLAANLRSRASWSRISAMGLAGGAVVGVPAITMLLLTGRPLTDVLADSDINSGDPAVLRNMIFVVGRGRIFEFPDGSYMMHPSLLLDPVIAAAFLVGLPLLLPRLRRSPAAQLLFGTLYLTTVLVYVPEIATFLGEKVVLPGQIWRLAWPIPLAAVLTLGWLSWGLVAGVERRLGGLSRRPAFQRAARALPVLLVALLALAVLPLAASGMETVRAHEKSARSSGVYPPDPIYPWLQREMDGEEKPVVVLAPDVESARIPAFSSEVNVVSRRGALVLGVLPELEERVSRPIRVPQGSLDVREFFSGTTVRQAVGILRRNEVDYVMVASGSPLAGAMQRLPGFEAVDEPSQRYDVYRVNLDRLARLVGP